MLRLAAKKAAGLINKVNAECIAATGQRAALLITCGAGMEHSLMQVSILASLISAAVRGFGDITVALYKHLGYRFEDMANPVWFETAPEIAWGFYGHRLNLYRKTVPHAGFNLLHEMAKTIFDGEAFVFTSNVDGQWQKAGWPAARIYECHGSLHYLQCSQPRSCYHASLPKIVAADQVRISIDESEMTADAECIPKCHRGCGNIARPNVLMFGDPYWVTDRADEQELRFSSWLSCLLSSARHICVVDIGSGTALPTVRLLAERVAVQFKGRSSLIRINPRESSIAVSSSIGADRSVELPSNGLEGIQQIAVEMATV